MRFPIYKVMLVRAKGQLLDQLPRSSAELTEQVWSYFLANAVDVHKQMQSRNSANELHTLFSEYRYWQKGCRVFYIDTAILEFVYNAKFDIDFEMLKRVCVAHGSSFSFAFAENATINGHRIIPLMINLTKQSEYKEQLTSFSNALNIQFEYEHILSVYGRQSTDEYIYARHATEQHIKEYLSPSMNSLEAFNGDTDSMTAMHVHLRLAYALLTFMLVFPDTIHEGFPESMGQREERYARNASKGARPPRSLTLPQRFRNAPIPHMRHGHFRTLRHERYARTPNGHPRVIYVNDMLVSKRTVTPHSVVNV